MSHPQIYTSPFVITTVDEIICNGAVVADSTAILDVGKEQDIKEKWPNARITTCNGILLPPLINCHIHLELSHLTGMTKPAADNGMVSWIEELMQYRLHDPSTPEERVAASAHIAEKQYQQGVILLNDIGNIIDFSHETPNKTLEIQRTLEMVAPTLSRTEEMKKLLSELPDELPVSPHAPYSTTAELIVTLKKRAVANRHFMAIHLAESTAEIALLRTAEGSFRVFLEERDSWDHMLTMGETFGGGVYYLDELGVLDEKTLAVHCVHVDEAEIQILKNKDVKICLCPGSNHFLEVGTAPLPEMLEKGLLPGIGTDSLASNEELNMWREMQILRRTYPEISPAAILAMATKGGALALGRENDFGTLELGKKPVFLEVAFPDNCKPGNDIINYLTSSGQPETINWITPVEH